ncbi:MAG: hypothetical protein CO030_03140 [Candidatus Magasanikbacteria bacterium CG_4_9_14_0_2_um_filter_42_11]|uniref:GIY-YIG domain-containing protein n=1 Tax=Candidatus Magasanikbacteria bacterium CG_4_9_14_0_2_um_filter_42_11 TaxID=1974643 RepID=A0A2M8F9H7_9BACT|nr:MAG: hypothetical protein COU34_05170 [Candidatus Magasanikbacteria bacterium CG10_big_fil_rev_8_21_14_0_10_43_9]PIY92285.1 MAG: hypothetical protein COY70_04080 [Candidatus Magasanikbacteria bacterium CG_4_10_14_0_8_um_filter_42_12]PJC52392.1 MAG: hypothetical protein CO030_03140 [Candidatus Magasanikbacteria bacterium CG_4_9_14_0_2_um_filter_42_11]
MYKGDTFVYFLQSVSNPDRFYVGITLVARKEERLAEHNRGQTKSTSRFVPWVCIYSETYKTKSEAQKREQYLKSIKGFRERKSICEKYKDNSSVG